MITDVVEGTVRVLLNGTSPNLIDGEEVVVDYIFNFPATNSQFVTIRSLNRTNTNQHGKPEPIISTVRLTSKTFQEK
jgi:hypothetical protein